MKTISLIIIFIGIWIITVAIMKKTNQCDQKIKYRYLPSTMDQMYTESDYPSDIFKDMFTKDSAWISSKNTYDVRKQEEINKYFISQQ